ncbi:uncharacterized protein LOC117973464 [Acipenser ruthenus]|uniref:uncharacterized protein LOC117973464 n=1 Tax=Acipenser ruthenus TaxID=7906 RepID=UPI0027425E0E|nr:uncharacterized protein LOC117973464 [Acipenser ruthenus]
MPEDRTPIATKYPFHQCDHSNADRKPDSPQRQSTLTAQVYNYHCWVTWLADSCAEKTWPRGIHFRQCCDLACYMQQQHTWGYYWISPPQAFQTVGHQAQDRGTP